MFNMQTKIGSKRPQCGKTKNLLSLFEGNFVKSSFGVIPWRIIWFHGNFVTKWVRANFCVSTLCAKKLFNAGHTYTTTLTKVTVIHSQFLPRLFTIIYELSHDTLEYWRQTPNLCILSYLNLLFFLFLLFCKWREFEKKPN